MKPTLVSALLAGLALGLALPASSQACTTADGTPLVNGLLSALLPVVNKAWPSFAVNNGVDPLNDPCDGPCDVKLKCSYGGDEICGAQLSKCVKEWAEVDVDAVYGLSYLQFQDAQVTSLGAAAGTPCPYDRQAPGGPYSCLYAGEGTASAYLVANGQITARIPSIKLKVKCSFAGNEFSETLYSGSATCTVGQPTGKGTFSLCAGTCPAGATAANLGLVTVSALDLKTGSPPECDVKPDYSPASWIAEALVPALESELVAALTPPIESALNDLLADYLPFPGACAQ